MLGAEGLALVIAFVILSLSLHEAAHAWAANAQGDPTARLQGRMTWNPLVHIDPWMTLILPTLSLLFLGFLFGGARPVPVNPSNFKNPHRANALVAIAGPLSNFLLALVFMGAWILVLTLTDYEGNQLLPAVLRASALANVILAVFNLIPLPPLDGSRVVRWLMPSEARRSYDQLEPLGFVILIGLFYFVPGFSIWLGQTIQQAYIWTFELTNWVLTPVLDLLV
ncbi:MAG: site-2 protease family protein [Planctomycetota bacterium]